MHYGIGHQRLPTNRQKEGFGLETRLISLQELTVL
jgi:hypothetical protein